MSLIDWKQLVPDVTIAFSSFAIPETRNRFQANVAELRLKGGLTLDVAWNAEKMEYVLTLYGDDFNRPIKQLEVNDASDVIVAVKRLANPRPATNYSASNVSQPVTLKFVAYA